MGSTRSFTPRFSTQVSPSCTCSSNSNPYCSPEQPPPCTNTRSIRFGFPSPRIRSPTLRAAAAVNWSAGVSRTASVVLISYGLWSMVGSLSRRSRGTFRNGFPFVRNAGQLTHDLRAQRHFNDTVVNVPLDAGSGSKDDALVGEDVPSDASIQHNAPRFHVALNGARLAYG